MRPQDQNHEDWGRKEEGKVTKPIVGPGIKERASLKKRIHYFYASIEGASSQQPVTDEPGSSIIPGLGVVSGGKV